MDLDDALSGEIAQSWFTLCEISCIIIGFMGEVLLHLRSFFNNFVCAYHTLARIKVVHLRLVFGVTFARIFP